MSKMKIPIPDSGGRKASFRLSERDRQMILHSLTRDQVDEPRQVYEMVNSPVQGDDETSQVTESSVNTRRIAVKQEEVRKPAPAKKKFSLGKNKVQEPPQKLVFSFSTDSEPGLDEGEREEVDRQQQLEAGEGGQSPPVHSPPLQSAGNDIDGKLNPRRDGEVRRKSTLSVIEIVNPGRSPSLRRLSMATDAGEPSSEKTQFYKNKKSAGSANRFATGYGTDLVNSPPSPDLSVKHRFNSETSMKSIPTMTFNYAEDNLHPGHQASNSDSGYKSLRVAQNYDRMDAGSMRSYRSNSRSIHSHEKSLKEERKVKVQRFWDFLTMVLSMFYGIAVVIIGLVIYAYDILKVEENLAISPFFNLFLCIIGIIWLAYLVYDITMYIRAIEGSSRGSIDLGDMKLVEGEDGELHVEMSLPEEKKTLPEYYGFSSGRHAGSFYLKIGAGLFCMGHVVHMGLNFIKEIILSSTDVQSIKEYCSSPETLSVDIITPIYSLLQCFFIFKYGNTIVNKKKWLARFAFMHCISATICFWMNTIINETLDALVVKYFYTKDSCGNDHGAIHPNPKCSKFSEVDDDDDNSFENYDSTLGEVGSISNTFFCILAHKYRCASSTHMSQYLFDFSSYLYPFSIEFSILVVGIWYIMWSNIGKIDNYKDSLHFLPSVTPHGSTEDLRRTEGHKQALILFADCSSSNKGMFLGVIIFVLSIITCIVVFVMESSCDKDAVYASVTVGNVAESALLAIMVLATVSAYLKIVKLDVNPHPISFLDDMLLFICIPSYILYFLVCLGPSIADEVEWQYLTTNLFTLFQVAIQTPLIVDGLRRCARTYSNQSNLEGRNTIMFLIVANLAIYFFETLLIKTKANQKLKIEFYGKIGWSVLSHITLPLCIFYRFHSSAALVDIWNSAYKPPENH